MARKACSVMEIHFGAKLRLTRLHALVIDDRRRQESCLINCPRTKMSAHASNESDSSRKCHNYSDTLLGLPLRSLPKHINYDSCNNNHTLYYFLIVSVDAKKSETGCHYAEDYRPNNSACYTPHTARK
jgi:hypothetical protein